MNRDSARVVAISYGVAIFPVANEFLSSGLAKAESVAPLGRVWDVSACDQ